MVLIIKSATESLKKTKKKKICSDVLFPHKLRSIIYSFIFKGRIIDSNAQEMVYPGKDHFECLHKYTSNVLQPVVRTSHTNLL